MNIPKVSGYVLIGMFGAASSMMGITFKNWEFYVILTIVIAYGVARWREGINDALQEEKAD